MNKEEAIKIFKERLINRRRFWGEKLYRRTSHAEMLMGKPMVEYSGDALHLIETFLQDLDYLMRPFIKLETRSEE